MEIKTPYIWKNGKLIAWDDAVDHHLSHSLHYGGGVFEGIRFYDTDKGPKIFRLKDHIDRLFYSASVVGLEIPFTKDYIMNETIKLLENNQEKTGYIRHIVYSGYGKMGLNPYGAKTETVISVWKWGKYLSENPIRVKIAKIRRVHPSTTDMNAKISGNYANSILVSQEIKKAGFDEGLLLDTEGFIAEGPGENIFFVKGNEVVTPRLGTILPGITRNSIIHLFKDEFGINVTERKISPEELGDFNEAFFTGTAAEVTLIGSITDENGKEFSFGSGDENSISQKIRKLFLEVTSGKVDKYNDWLF
ncbi:MAG: branched-chain amino acid transaminase [Candidatus Gracilibacteria bacterium]|nr:branched-chain amino acid transaminase [Candidatus Gracilibacteria bacterium]